MKSIISNKFYALLSLLFMSITAMAQDGKLLDIDINVGEPEWYENPYVWIGVAIVLLLVIIAFRKKS